ncbi:hypothetical protein [Streptococcus ovis]|uniref:hypothetical protein n=1 Tax=Streptococcus ovis TaxID=82806 RepID=UPI00037E785D|nr:hypothetical protein [Streptococcus ovis]
MKEFIVYILKSKEELTLHFSDGKSITVSGLADQQHEADNLLLTNKNQLINLDQVCYIDKSSPWLY